MKLGSQGTINDRQSRSCIHHKVIRAGAVQHDGNNHQGATGNAWAYTGHISRAVRFSTELGKHDQGETGRCEPPERFHGRAPQPGWLGELSACGFAWSLRIPSHFPKTDDGFTRDQMEQRGCIFRFADVEVDERNFSVTKAGEVLPLEPKAFKVLQFL